MAAKHDEICTKLICIRNLFSPPNDGLLLLLELVLGLVPVRLLVLLEQALSLGYLCSLGTEHADSQPNISLLVTSYLTTPTCILCLGMAARHLTTPTVFYT